MSVRVCALTDTRLVLLVGLCTTCSIAAWGDEERNLGHGGEREKFYSAASASEDHSKAS